MIVVTVSLTILNKMEFKLVHNQKENCHRDHISFNSKGNENPIHWVYLSWHWQELINSKRRVHASHWHPGELTHFQNVFYEYLNTREKMCQLRRIAMPSFVSHAKLNFGFPSNWKECVRSDSFPFAYEPNRIWFGS